MNSLSMGAVVSHTEESRVTGQLQGGGLSGEVVFKLGLLGWEKGKEGHC